MLISVIYLIGSFVICKLLLRMFFNLLYNGGSIKKNFKGENIPVGMGIIFIPVIVINIVVLLLFKIEVKTTIVLLFLIANLTMALLGLLDDLLGNRDVTGLKGHLMMIFKGQLSTGGLKALLGGCISLIISIIISNSWLDIIINTGVIALFTNFINLLDLRPGRAIKGFLLGSCILFFQPIYKAVEILTCGLMGSVLAYLPYDLKAKSMLGDVGSNVLGITLGLLWTYEMPLSVRAGALLFLVSIHIYAEKYSITETIQKSKVLRYVDEIGRK